VRASRAACRRFSAACRVLRWWECARDYKGEVPEGYFVARSRTYGVWFPGRGFKVNGDPKPAVEAIKRTLRIYPLAQVNNPPTTNFINVSGIPHNTIHANNSEFYEELNQIVQEEPSESLDPETLGLFASIGIEKGKPFAPDERMKKILIEAAAVGNATARATDVSDPPEGSLLLSE